MSKDQHAAKRKAGAWAAVGSILAAGTVMCATAPTPAQAQAQNNSTKPNILVIWGDDIGRANVSAYTFGMMGYDPIPG